MYTIWCVCTYTYTFDTITTVKVTDIQLYILVIPLLPQTSQANNSNH